RANPLHHRAALEHPLAAGDLDLEVDPAADRLRLAGANEEATDGDVGGVLLDELVEPAMGELHRQADRFTNLKGPTSFFQSRPTKAPRDGARQSSSRSGA